ncbi:MAG: nucleoside hydrolase [Actinobacteria bacterium]|nr:nucleoside hydrolase [Actinomycetota bacterium]
MNKRLIAIAALVAVTGLVGVTGCSTGAESGTSARPTVLVSDFGLGLAGGWREGPSDVDDAMALALADASDRFDIQGIVTTFGNTIAPPQAVWSTPAFLGEAGIDAAIEEGARRALSDPAATFTGTEVVSECKTEGVEFLAQQAMAHDDLLVLGIGPLTSVACLQLTEPEAAARIGGIVALMGAQPGTPFEINGIAVSDFNFGMDVRATRIVLEQTDIPVTFMTFEAATTATVAAESIAGLTGKTGAYFAEQSAGWVDFWTEKFSQNGIYPFDAHTVRYVTNPQDYTCAEVGFKVDLPASYQLGSQTNNTAARLLVGPGFDSRRVTACTGFVNAAAQESFVDATVAALQR